MAVCAIVVARQGHTTESQSPHLQTLSSKGFYQAAVAAFPTDLSKAQGFEFKRAKVLMAIACIQYGAILEHQTHLGEYVVLACNDGFQDEARWERGLTEIQRQERRRLVCSLAFLTSCLSLVLVSVYLGGLFSDHLGRRSPVPRTPMQRRLPARDL
jgi:hypothetical protein